MSTIPVGLGVRRVLMNWSELLRYGQQRTIVCVELVLKRSRMNQSYLWRNEQQHIRVAVTLAMLIMVDLLLYFVYPINFELALSVQCILSITWFIGMLIYLMIGSRSRWPEASAFQRFANVVTFKR